MSGQKTKLPRTLKAQRLFSVVFALSVNILLYLMVDGLFAIDLTLSSGKVLL